MDLDDPGNYLKLKIGILDSLLRQWNVFEYFNTLNFSRSLAIITGQRSFSSLLDGFPDITSETKNSFEHFHCKINF